MRSKNQSRVLNRNKNHLTTFKLFFMRTIKHLLFITLFATLTLIFSQAKARDRGRDRDNDSRQNRNRDDGDRHDNHDNDNNSGQQGSNVPLDGGITLLLAAGVGYGVKKVIANKKLKEKHSDIQ